MKIKVVGIQVQDYKLDNGYTFKGRKLHAIDLDSVTNGQIGNQVINLKIADDSVLAAVPVEVGETYTAYFTNKGTLDTLIPVE